MTATRPRLTAPPADLLAAVETRYDGAPFTPVCPLSGGWANDIFLLESRLGRVVLRRKYPPSDAASIAWEHELLARLKPELPQVVAPMGARDGSTFFVHEGDAVTLVPFVEGRTADRADEPDRLAAARLLGRLHALTFELVVPPRPGVDGLAQLRALNAGALPHDWRRRIEPLHREALELVEQLTERALVRGIVHGDFFPGNVLVRGDEAVALLDWEEAHRAPLVSELAAATWEFTKSKATDDFDRDAAARFLRAYRAADGPVPADEDELIVPLIRAKRVLEILRAPADRGVDWEYQRHNLRSAENLR